MPNRIPLNALKKTLIAAVIAQAIAFASAFAQAPDAKKTDSVYTYDKFSSELSKSVNRDFSSGTVWTIIFVVANLVIAVVVYEVYNSNKSRQMLLDVAWEKFHEHADELKLSEKNIALLTNIARMADLQDPHAIIKSPHVFETSIEAYYESHKLSSMSSAELGEIRDLRRAMKFLPLSGEIAFTSTRQFSNGEKCLLQIPDSGPASHKGACMILSVSEKEWSVERPSGRPIAPGSRARINLTRPGDAEYSFKAEVIRDSGEELFLSHSSKLNRTQQRNWVRVDVNLPVEIIKMENETRIGDMFEGSIIDMSGGGFGITIPVKLLNGTKLCLTFDLPGHEPVKNLMVKVVRVAGAFKGDASKIIHSVALEGDVSKVQEQITRYVFEMQRKAIAARNIG